MFKPRVVILGAGFGGTYVAKRLASLVRKGDIEVTIVNKTNYFLFTPLLHEVATGSLTPNSVAEPLREIFAHTGVELCQGTIDSIDTENRRVHVMGNSKRHTLVFDYLVIATGAETNHYDVPGAQKFTYPLKNLADAARIRDRVIDSFEEAIFCEDPAERLNLLSFAVVGGGPTGVELAAEMAEFINGLVKRYYNHTAPAGDGSEKCSREESTIGLVDGSSELLARFSSESRKVVAERLIQVGVNLHLGAAVKTVTPRGLALANNTTVPAATVIWAAGVKPMIPDFVQNIPDLSNGRLSVDRFYRLKGSERVFALGDAAGSSPMLAQVAVQQAKTVAYNIVASIKGKPLKVFRYRPLGSLISVGQWFAVGEVFSVKISGRLAWWLWRTVYLFKFASWKKRIRIAFEWFLDALYPRDITKLT